MNLSQLSALSPLDGRYRNKLSPLAPYFSEYGWIHYRLKVEIAYYLALLEVPLPHMQALSSDQKKALENIAQHFTETDAARVKEIEKGINHDVKAVEYFIAEQFATLGLESETVFIHFALTSQDINNTAVPLLLKDAMDTVLVPAMQNVIDTLQDLSHAWQERPMLARTHGQAASPTRLGKEFKVFATRLQDQLDSLKSLPHRAKFGGATGNFNAHALAYPEVDWVGFSNHFIQRLGLERTAFTTQIEPYDFLAAQLDAFKRFNTILIDLNRDIWHYISIHYFKQKINLGEVGSSTMPHKVNPIDFENSEGNLGVANALFEFMSTKLPISRMQRDLTDSTVMRNLGVPLGHSFLAWQSTLKGLAKLELNASALEQDLEDNWPVVAEAIQTILRREKYPNAYEKLKELTRTGDTINQEAIARFIEGLAVTEEVKAELQKITPQTYLGLNADQLGQ